MRVAVKIAIYEPEPRICGPMTCAYHLQAGFRKLGHECDVITFTKSGKPSVSWGSMRKHIRWYRRAPDVTARYADATSVIRRYDAVILSDVRTILQDKEALRGAGAIDKSRPDYLVVLEKAGVRFTTALHGNYYPPKEVVFAAELLSLPCFSGSAIAYAPRAMEASKSIWPQVEWIHSTLPYQMTSDPASDEPSPGTAAGITGRYIPNKGHHLLGITAALGKIPGDVELWGACSVGAGPSQSYHTFEAMTKVLGLTGVRDGNEPWTPSGGDIIRPHTWMVNGPAGVISYKGGYEDPIATCRRLSVHADLTGSNFSHGMEFSQFESIDAGCTQVSVESMWHHAFTGTVIPAMASVPGEKKLLGTDEGKELTDMLGGAVFNALSRSSATRRAAALHNRQALAAVNDPAVVASQFLEAL